VSIGKAYRWISFRIVRWRGVEVYIDLTTLLIIWIYSDMQGNNWLGNSRWVAGVLIGLLVIASILIHELAHAWIGLLCGAQVDKIYLNVLGGVCLFRSTINSHWRNFLITVAGPLSNLALYFLFTQAYKQGFQHGDMSAWSVALESAATINLLLAILNILPAYPLDGGQALRYLVAMVTRREIIGAWLTTFTGLGVIGLMIWLTIRAMERLSAFDVGMMMLFMFVILLASYAQLKSVRNATRKKANEAKASNLNKGPAITPTILEVAQNRLCQPFLEQGQYDYSLVYKKKQGPAAVRAWYEAQVNGLRRPFESIMVTTRLGPTHLLAFGSPDKPAVLLLDGPNSYALNWKRVVPYLTQDYRVLAVDIPGGLNLSAPVRPAANAPEYGWWLNDVMDALKLERAHLVGEMGGCWPIFKLATLNRERIASASLITPYGLIAQGLHNVRFKGFFYELLTMLIPNRALIAQHFCENMTPQGIERPKDVIEEAVDTLLLYRKHYNLQVSPIIFTEQELGQLTAPTLLLIGQEALGYIPSNLSEQARKVFPQLWGTVIVPNSGGSVTTDQAEWLGWKLPNFWAEVQSREVAKPDGATLL
jgi:pimeloyl-ACP methyl ester carboxylesterase/Zn-dependent protease